MLSERLQLFEIGDQPFLPRLLRELYHDCLGFVAKICGFYDKLYVPFSTWTKDSAAAAVLDVASGGGEPIDTMLQTARSRGVPLPKVVLSDLYPNTAQFEKLQERHSSVLLDYCSEPLSAESACTGDYPLISICAAFHHFPPAEARQLVQGALRSGKGIFIAEPFERRWAAAASAALLGPLIGMCAPFRRYPPRLTGLLFCTLIPIVPLMVAFDGVVSVLRMYTADELQEMVPSELRDSLRVRFGRLETKTRLPATFFYAIRR